MFSITFKLSDTVSTENKRDFNIDALLEDNDKTFDNISEYNQYVSLLENIKEKNEIITLGETEYSIESIKTVTNNNLSNITLVVTLEEPSIYQKLWDNFPRSGYHHTYVDQSQQFPYTLINGGSGTTTNLGNDGSITTNGTVNYTDTSTYAEASALIAKWELVNGNLNELNV